MAAHGDSAEFILENIKQSTRLMIDHEDPKDFVSTYASRAALKILRRFGSILIKGISGSGKSRLGLKLLQEIFDSDNRIPIVLTSYRQWHLIPKLSGTIAPSGNTLSTKYVVLIDNIFGSSNLVEARVEEWSRMFNIMLPSVESGKIFLIITSRPEIISQCHHRLKKYTLMDSIQSVCLYTGHCQLKNYEKIKIVKICCGKMISFSEDEIENILDIDTSIGLPQCCKFYAKSREAQAKGIQFFHKPFDYIAQEVAILQETDPLGYMVLLIVALNSGCLESNMFRPLKCTQDFRDLVETLVDVCSTPSKPNLKGIEIKAESLCGVFLEKNQGNFQFVHQTVFDAVFMDIAKTFPKRCIAVCSAGLLVELVQTKDKSQTDGVVVCLDKNEYRILVDRIIHLILSENCLEILDHPSLHNDEFLQVMFDSLTQEDKLNQLVSMTLPEESHVQEFSALDDSKEDVETVQAKVTLFVYSNILSLMTLKNIRLVELVLDAMGQNLTNELIRELLSCAVYVNNKKMCKKLINIGAVPNDGCVRALCGSPHINEETPELNKLILEKFVKWDETVDMIENLICLAADKGNTSLVQMLCENMTEKYFIDDLGKVLTSILEMSLATNYNKYTGQRNIVVESTGEAILAIGCDCDLDYLVWLASSHFSSTMLKLIMKKDVDVNRRYLGTTSLHQAVQFGSAVCVFFLLAHGADMSIRVKDNGNTVLHLAAETLTEGGAKMHILCEHSRSMKWPSQVADMKKENDLNDSMNIRKCVIYRRNSDLSTTLCMPNLGQTTNMKTCIKTGAMVNAINYTGNTALHLAVDNEATGCVKILLEANAFVNATNFLRCTPLNGANNSNVDVVQVLLEAGSDVNYAKGPVGSCLHIAIVCGDIKTIKLLLNKGADVNVKNKHGQTCLMSAATHGDLNLIKYICEQGAKTDVIDNYGQTVIHRALEFETETIEKLQYLLDVQHAPVDVKDIHGRTAMFPAVESGDTEIVELLNDRGFDMQQVDEKGNTLLHATCEVKTRNLDGLLKILISGKKYSEQQTPKEETMNNINSQNDMGNTVLTLLAKNNLSCDLNFLVDNGANPNIPDHQGRTALHYMAENGRSDYIRIMMDAGANPCIRNSQGKTPLQLSIDRDDHISIKLLLNGGADSHVTDSHGRLDVSYGADKMTPESVQLLLNRGADINELDNQGRNQLSTTVYQRQSELEREPKSCLEHKQNRTPLHIACANRNENEYVHLLLEKGAKPSSLDDYGQTPLHIAAEKDNSEYISLLLQKGADPNITNNHHLTALHTAAEKGHSECMKLLLDNGADINALAKWGKSVLHIAAENGNTECISILLDRGIDPNIKDKRGRIPLHSAIDGKIPLVKLLLERGSNPSSRDRLGNALLNAAAGNEIGEGELVRLLLEKGADPNVADRGGKTPLHHACLSGCRESIRFLIGAGADLNTYDENERTPLTIAAKRRSSDFVQTLLEGGAKPDLSDKDGWTPLHFASLRAKKDITALLLSKEININALNSRRQTPLHIAVSSENINIIKLLLNRGAKVSLRDDQGKTPLHIAAEKSTCDFLLLLLDNGADLFASALQERTSLHIAAEVGQSNSVEVLLSRGADVFVRDNKGRTPLHLTLATIMKMQQIVSKEASLYLSTLSALMEHGADISVKDFEDKSPLDMLQLLKMNQAELSDSYLPGDQNMEYESKYIGSFLHALHRIGKKQQFERNIDMTVFIQWVADILQGTCD